MQGASKNQRRYRLQHNFNSDESSIFVSGGAFEVALLDAHTGHAEVGAVAQHGEQYMTEPMRYSYDRGLVTAPRADPGEVRVQGMDGTACVVRRLT